jgi:hypothetical protein
MHGREGHGVRVACIQSRGSITARSKDGDPSSLAPPPQRLKDKGIHQ